MAFIEKLALEDAMDMSRDYAMKDFFQVKVVGSTYCSLIKYQMMQYQRRWAEGVFPCSYITIKKGRYLISKTKK